MSDTLGALMICAVGGFIVSEAVVRFIGKFKYGKWATITPPAWWFEIVKKHFVLLLIIFLAVTFGLFFVASSAN